MYRLVFSTSKMEDKYSDPQAIDCEVFGDRDAVWNIWFTMKDTHPHIKILDMVGNVQKPENGIDALYESGPW